MLKLLFNRQTYLFIYFISPNLFISYLELHTNSTRQYSPPKCIQNLFKAKTVCMVINFKKCIYITIIYLLRHIILSLYLFQSQEFDLYFHIYFDTRASIQQK